MATTSHFGQKRCPDCSKWIKGTRTKTCPYCNHQFQSKPRAAKPRVAETVVPAVVAVAKAGNGQAITLDQISKVASTVKALGGYKRMTDVLGVISELGGVKKFRQLAEAIEAPQADVVPV